MLLEAGKESRPEQVPAEESRHAMLRHQITPAPDSSRPKVRRYAGENCVSQPGATAHYPLESKVVLELAHPSVPGIQER